MNIGPPGLSNSTHVVAPHYSTLFSIPTATTTSNREASYESIEKIMNDSKSTNQISYARAVAPSYNPSISSLQSTTATTSISEVQVVVNTNQSQEESLHYVQSPMGDYQIPSRRIISEESSQQQQQHSQQQQQPISKPNNVFSLFDLNPELIPPSNHQPVFSAKRPLLFNNNTGSGYVQTSIPNLQKPTPDFRYPKGKFMSASDVR